MIAHLIAPTVSAVGTASMTVCARQTSDETVDRDFCRAPGYGHAWSLAGLQVPL